MEIVKEVNYKNVVIRPRLETYNEWIIVKKDQDKRMYGKTFEDEWYSRTWRFYWERIKHWFVFFPNGRIIKTPKGTGLLPSEDFFKKCDKIIAKVERESTTDYGKFAILMQNLIANAEDLKGFLVYPTTYGIGLEAIFNWNFDEQSKFIEKFLTDLGIEFKTEYSDAHWVFRYKISKKEANRILIRESIE